MRRDGSGEDGVAFAVAEPGIFRRTFAHEVGHLLGRKHSNTEANALDENCRDLNGDWGLHDPEWYGRFPDSKIQDFGLDAAGNPFGWLIASNAAVKNPAFIYDYMSWCYTTEASNWTSPWTYAQVFSESLRADTVQKRLHDIGQVGPMFLASGLIDKEIGAWLNPLFGFAEAAVPLQTPGTAYCLDLENAGGAQLSSYCFDLDFENEETGASEQLDGFAYWLPDPGAVERIVLRSGLEELVAQVASSHAPTVTVRSPNGGESWSPSGMYTISWSSGDQDNDPLAYNVLYSDDGSEWIPLAMGIPETSLAVKTDDLAGSEFAKIRIMVSDGFLTAQDDSDGAFFVASKGPIVTILAPQMDGSIARGGPFILHGYAYDMEDGELSGTSLEWASSLDGILGYGVQLIAELTFGQHEITFTATDSDGKKAAATIHVYVGYRTYLPAMNRW